MELIAHDVASLLKHIKIKTRVSRHKGEQIRVVTLINIVVVYRLSN